VTPRRLIVLLAVVAAVVGVQSAAATNSPNVRLNYSLPDPTSGRTDSDLAFWGNIGVAGNYDGFRVFDTSTGQQLVSFLCRGPQNDVSLWEHNGRLLFQSIDTPQRNLDGVDFCSQVRSSDTTACGPPFCFEGIRIFDLSNPTAPVLIKSVQTDCGSHTHTIVPDLANARLLLYISSYPGSSGPNCQSPFRKISIVTVPLNAPETASVLSQPQLTTNVPGCPDITVFMAIHKAAVSCATEGQIWDITDPANPIPQPGARHRLRRELLAFSRVHLGRPVRRVGRRELHGYLRFRGRRENLRLPRERRATDELAHDPAPAGHLLLRSQR
jgi:hypothetical protein